MSDDRTKKNWERRKDARPQEIIEAGIAEFAEKGFAAARLTDVAKRAGIAKGTIYLYFDNKEALFEQAIISKVSPTIEHVETLVDQFPGSTSELLRMMITVAYTRLLDDDVQQLLRIIIAEGHRFPAITEAHYRNSVSKALKLLGHVLERGVARGEFKKSALTETPMVIMAPAIMSTVWNLTFNAFQPIEREKFLNAHLDLLFEGLMRQ